MGCHIKINDQSTKSGVDLDLHPGVEVIIVAVDLAVLAVEAFALLGALLSCPEALAIIFAAFRLFAGAPAQGDEGRDALEGAGVAEVGHLLRLVDLKVAARLVVAADAQALLVAQPPLREALAVHLEAVDLRALAPRVPRLPRRQVQRADCPQHVAFLRSLGLVDQQVEQVLVRSMPADAHLQLGIGDQLQRAGGGGGALGSHFKILTQHQLNTYIHHRKH